MVLSRDQDIPALAQERLRRRRTTVTHDFWTNHDGSVILQLRKADVNGDMVVELVQTAFDSANLDLPSGQFMCP